MDDPVGEDPWQRRHKIEERDSEPDRFHQPDTTEKKATTNQERNKTGGRKSVLVAGARARAAPIQRPIRPEQRKAEHQEGQGRLPSHRERNLEVLASLPDQVEADQR